MPAPDGEFMTKVTLKDIAVKCGVSATVVSAVLNKRNGRISCSDAKRQEIEAVAKELNYHPNLLARSMVCKRVPIVAVMLKSGTIGYNDGDYSYFVRNFPVLTRGLNARGLEVLFVPYLDEKEQIKKFENLSLNGFAGGIVTNVNPLNYHNIARRLVDSRIPHIMLGNPKGTDACCIYYEGNSKTVKKYADAHGLPTMSLVTSVDGDLQLFDYPFTDNYMWLQKPRRLEVEDLRDKSRLYVCSSTSVFYRLPERPEHIIIYEDLERRAELPPGIPAVMNNLAELSRRRMEMAAAIIGDWMCKDIKPAVNCHVLHGDEAELMNFN